MVVNGPCRSLLYTGQGILRGEPTPHPVTACHRRPWNNQVRNTDGGPAWFTLIHVLFSNGRSQLPNMELSSQRYTSSTHPDRHTNTFTRAKGHPLGADLPFGTVCVTS